jgi:hypothetical protein
MEASCKPLGPRRRLNARQTYLLSLLLLGGTGSVHGLIAHTRDLRAPLSVSSFGISERNGRTSKRPRGSTTPLFAEADLFKETQDNEDKSSPENLQPVGRKRQQRKKPRNRRPRHYWSDPNNFKAELEQFWSDCGVDPSDYPTLLIPNEGLLVHYGRHDLRAALSSAGGRPLVAELLDARIMPGRWQEAVQEEQIQALIQVDDSLSEDQSPSATASSSEDKWSHQSGRKPKGYWTLQRVVEGLYEYVDGVRKEHGRPAVWMPRPNELIASGRDDLRQAMERFGGTKQICQLAGMVPFREWYFFEGQLELLCGLKDYIDEYENSDYTKFPNASDIRRNGCEQLYSLIQYYGGRKYLAFRLGMSSGSILPTDDFVGVNWGPFDLVFAVALLGFVREDHLGRPPPLTTPLLKMPRREKLQEEEVWLHEEVERYGGYENVARRLGLAFFD